MAPDLAQPKAGPTACARWYAVWTRANHESAATDALLGQNINAFLPAVRVPSRRRDRCREIARPLFPGYFFVKTALAHEERVAIRKAPGVVSILGSAVGPVPVPEWQVSSVQLLLTSRRPLQVLFNLIPGKRVRIAAGPLAGVEGVFVAERAGGRRLVVSVELLGRSVALELASDEVRAA